MKKLITTLCITLSLLSFANEKKCLSKTCSFDITTQNVKKAQVVDIESSIFKKKYVIYSAIWCSHCKAQYEHIQKIYDRYGDDMNISVIVSSDVSKESIEKYFAYKNYTFKVYYDVNNIIAEKFKVKMLPSIYEMIDDYNITNASIDGISLEEYEKIFRTYNNDIMMKRLEKYSFIDKEGNELKIKDILLKDAILMYGSPKCSDCKEELNRLRSLKKDIIYLVESRNFSFDEYVEYTKTLNDNEKAYYVKDFVDFRKDFNIKWIPSVTNIKDYSINGNFVRNNLILIK